MPMQSWPGQQFRYVPCLNGDAAWVDALAQLVATNLHGWNLPVAPTRQEKGSVQSNADSSMTASGS